jgi:hypothetical protein
MSLKAIPLEHRKELLHLPSIMNILGKDVFVERIADGPVDEEQVSFANRSRQTCQESQAFSRQFGIGPFFQLSPCPKNRLLGGGTKTFWVDQSPIIVIPQNAGIHLQDIVDALAWIGSVANAIAKAYNSFTGLPRNVSEHPFERFEVTVNIANNGYSQRLNPFNVPRGVDRLTYYQETLRRKSS